MRTGNMWVVRRRHKCDILKSSRKSEQITGNLKSWANLGSKERNGDQISFDYLVRQRNAMNFSKMIFDKSVAYYDLITTPRKKTSYDADNSMNKNSTKKKNYKNLNYILKLRKKQIKNLY